MYPPAQLELFVMPTNSPIAITTTIKREFLVDIIEGTKIIEYREAKDYWRKRLDGLKYPFNLRLINGMSKDAPEVCVRIDKITMGKNPPEFRLHIGAVVWWKNWDKRTGEPSPDGKTRYGRAR